MITPEKLAPVQGYSAGIPWSMHLRAYDSYCKLYGKQQAMIEGNCRGGFGTEELDVFIPGWRDELSQMKRLQDALIESERQNVELRNDPKLKLGQYLFDCIAAFSESAHEPDATKTEMADAYIRVWKDKEKEIAELRELLGEVKLYVEMIANFAPSIEHQRHEELLKRIETQLSR